MTRERHARAPNEGEQVDNKKSRRRSSGASTKSMGRQAFLAKRRAGASERVGRRLAVRSAAGSAGGGAGSADGGAVSADGAAESTCDMFALRGFLCHFGGGGVRPEAAVVAEPDFRLVN